MRHSCWIGIESCELTAADERRLQHPRVSGVVLFARNWRDAAQLAALTAAIRTCRPELAIAVDQEGGRVQRLIGDGLPKLPPLRTFGEQWQRSPDAAVATISAHGEAIGQQLVALGVTVNFAPVVDLDWGVCAAIGDRALSRDPVAVTVLAAAFADGMRRAGVMPVFKHFPGHGAVREDSHTALPVDMRPFATLWHTDLVPYRVLATRAPAVMVAHVVYAAAAPEPASFSRFWQVSVLREIVGFSGLVISDDLGMAAAAWAGQTLFERLQAFFAAGGDVALLCNDFAAIDAALEEFSADPCLTEFCARRHGQERKRDA